MLVLTTAEIVSELSIWMCLMGSTLVNRLIHTSRGAVSISTTGLISRSFRRRRSCRCVRLCVDQFVFFLLLLKVDVAAGRFFKLIVEAVVNWQFIGAATVDKEEEE
jgi:hypothetical protein